MISRCKILFLISALIATGCGRSDSLGPEREEGSDAVETGAETDDEYVDPRSGWLVPVAEVYDGGVGRDGIPAITDPDMLSASSGDSWLDGEDIVYGIVTEDAAQAYPQRILDWHEIINHGSGDLAFALTYCPLTGSAVGMKRTVDGRTTTFGVSGLLYNSNLIAYDRLTESYWSQMQLRCITGPNMGDAVSFVQVVETRWDVWKAMYPETRVMSDITGFARPYADYPYEDYKTSSALKFPVAHHDSRFFAKDRVHGVLVAGEAVIFPLIKFPESPMAYNHLVSGLPVVTAGSGDSGIAVSFARRLHDGTILTFTGVEDMLPVIMADDQSGSRWDITGRCVSGSYEGSRLEPVTAFNAYWFAWAAFHDDLAVHDM